MKMLIKLAALAALCLPAAASAQQMLTLKGAPANSDGRVTVGDVFDNAGPIAGVLLGYRSGATVILDAATVQSVVGANGGYWANPRGQHRIVVTAGTSAVRTVANAAPPAAQPQRIAQPENPFPPQPSVAAPVTAPAPLAVAATTPVTVPAVGGPIVVHRLESVDVTWSTGGLSLTMSGVVQKDAAAGDTVAVDLASKKVVDAVITGPGRAVFGPSADSYRAMQLSSR